MSGFLNLILRGLALICTIIVTGLIGNVIARDHDASPSARAAVNFTMFVAALSWLACLYGIVATVVGSLGRPRALAALDGLAVLFTFIGAVVLAARIGRTDCADLLPRPPAWIAFGSANPVHRCRELQAADAFMWFLWAALCGALFLDLAELRSPIGAARSSRPAMAQV